VQGEAPCRVASSKRRRQSRKVLATRGEQWRSSVSLRLLLVHAVISCGGVVRRGQASVARGNGRLASSNHVDFHAAPHDPRSADRMPQGQRALSSLCKERQLLPRGCVGVRLLLHPPPRSYCTCLHASNNQPLGVQHDSDISTPTLKPLCPCSAAIRVSRERPFAASVAVLG
jgi:hypothetical protein